MVNVYRTFSSAPEKIDEAMVREIEGRSYDRSFYPIGFTRQSGAILASGNQLLELIVFFTNLGDFITARLSDRIALQPPFSGLQKRFAPLVIQAGWGRCPLDGR